MNPASRILNAALLIFALGITCTGQTPPPPCPDGLRDFGERVRICVPDGLKTRPSQSIPQPPVSRAYALVVGVGRYQNSKLNLQFSGTDADAMYRVLINPQGGAFPAANVHLLKDSQATLENLKHYLEDWLPSVAKDNDLVLVYFAGHGVVAEGKGYLAPYDVDATSETTLAKTGYPMAQLTKVLSERVKARWKVLFADACHSQKINGATTDESLAKQTKDMTSGFFTLTAARESEFSHEYAGLETGFGVFTFFLIQGLQGQADADCDGVVTADELVEYVRENVRNYVHEQGGQQNPNEYGEYPDDFVLGLTGTAHCPPPPEIKTGNLTIETNLDNVRVFVNDQYKGVAAPGKPLPLPGLKPDVYTIRGERDGYEPATVQAIVVPGQTKTCTLRIQYRREYKPSAIKLVEQGEKLLFKTNSAVDPLAVYSPVRQTPEDLKKARELFEQALKQQGNYAKAAYDLALVCQLLSCSKCMLDAFKRAISIDHSYVEARVQYAGALIEAGDPDEAIRQLTDALQIDPKNSIAESHLARAFLDEEIWDRAIDAANQALAINARNDQAYLWKADALRRSVAGIKNTETRRQAYNQAIDGYGEYLHLTDFSSPALEKVAFYFIGFGLGSRRHADRPTPFAYQRNLAYLGLCDCERELERLQVARRDCERAVKYDAKEPLAYFLLGNVFRDLFNATLAKPDLLEAESNYKKMIQINPSLQPYSSHAKTYIEDIQTRLPHVK